MLPGVEGKTFIVQVRHYTGGPVIMPDPGSALYCGVASYMCSPVIMPDPVVM